MTTTPSPSSDLNRTSTNPQAAPRSWLARWFGLNFLINLAFGGLGLLIYLAFKKTQQNFPWSLAWPVLLLLVYVIYRLSTDKPRHPRLRG